jgi:hypothetical protein
MNGLSQVLICFIAQALIITIVIELLMLFLQREKNYKIYLFSVLINVITNVSLNVGIQLVEPSYYYLVVTLSEAMIVLIEALAYFWICKDFKKSLRISLVCNLTSFLLGLILI